MNSCVVLLTLEDAGMLTDLLQEKQDELERWASVCVCEAAQQLVTTADTRKQPPPSTIPRAKISPSPKLHPENIKGKLQVKSMYINIQTHA
jgi:hypothetical protein